MIKERNEFPGIVLEEWNKRVSGSSMGKKWKLCCTRALTGTFQRKRCFLLANHRIVSFDVSRKNEIEFLATLRYSERREYRKIRVCIFLQIFTPFCEIFVERTAMIRWKEARRINKSRKIYEISNVKYSWYSIDKVYLSMRFTVFVKMWISVNIRSPLILNQRTISIILERR